MVERRVREGQDWLWDVTLSNDTDRIAFFLELSLLKDRHGDPVLPVRWDDNYVSLLPHEHKTISVRFAEADLQGEAAHVTLTGWNTPPRP
jgi:exo-1,4-beta-D-glucosaminidase